MTTHPAVARDRRGERHQATRREILDAAWENVRRRGVGDLSLREVADAVGMRAPSLYVYFPSKRAVYDAMFADGNRELLQVVQAADCMPADPMTRFRAVTLAFFDASVADPARHQLLFERPVPGFVPSAESYAAAVEMLELTRTALTQLGVTRPDAVDLYTALMSGLMSQQIANDPGGDRWRRLVDETMDMFFTHVGP